MAPLISLAICLLRKMEATQSLNVFLTASWSGSDGLRRPHGAKSFPGTAPRIPEQLSIQNDSQIVLHHSLPPLPLSSLSSYLPLSVSLPFPISLPHPLFLLTPVSFPLFFDLWLQPLPFLLGHSLRSPIKFSYPNKVKHK
jgi:hypothetical protein